MTYKQEYAKRLETYNELVAEQKALEAIPEEDSTDEQIARYQALHTEIYHASQELTF